MARPYYFYTCCMRHCSGKMPHSIILISPVIEHSNQTVRSRVFSRSGWYVIDKLCSSEQKETTALLCFTVLQKSTLWVCRGIRNILNAVAHCWDCKGNIFVVLVVCIPALFNSSSQNSRSLFSGTQDWFPLRAHSSEKFLECIEECDRGQIISCSPILRDSYHQTDECPASCAFSRAACLNLISICSMDNLFFSPVVVQFYLPNFRSPIVSQGYWRPLSIPV